jgi:hypothetical protein
MDQCYTCRKRAIRTSWLGCINKSDKVPYLYNTLSVNSRCCSGTFLTSTTTSITNFNYPTPPDWCMRAGFLKLKSTQPYLLGHVGPPC